MAKGVFQDLTGKRFGRLRVLQRVPNPKSFHPLYRCRCACGTECVVRGSSLTSKNPSACTRSCGCLHMPKGKEAEYHITIDGVTDTQAGWARRLGLSQRAFNHRYRKWLSPKAACTLPPRASMRRPRCP